MNLKLNEEQVSSFQENGYLIVKNFLNEKELSKLYAVATEDQVIKKNSVNLGDKSGKKTKLALWHIPGDDIYGQLTRSQSLVDSVDKLLGGEGPVCHFHSKLMQKEPKVGGAWEWHQDYGYWYRNGYLYPDQMLSVMVAITAATKENGCLQVIEQSHKIGRIEHGTAGEQTGASDQYVNFALQNLALVYVELMPGDLLFFHSNTLHRSEANLSDNARWSLISVYNRQTNIPYIDNALSSTTPINVTPDDSIEKAKDLTGISEGEGQFLDQQKAITK